MFTPRQIVPYLIGADLLTPDAIFDEGFRIECENRRNQNLRVVGGEKGGWFVKQGRNTRDDVGSLINEARFYGVFGRVATQSLRHFIPQSVVYDAANHLLLLESIPHSEDLWRYHTRTGKFPGKIARDTGEALGHLHEESANWLSLGQAQEVLNSPLPFVYQLAQPPVDILNGVSAAALKLIKVAQGNRTLCDAMATLAGEWRLECLIHGDIRLRNILAYRSSDKGRCRGVKLVDWEFASVGDPRWDVGALFSSYLSLWATSVPIVRNDQPDKLIHMARFPLERIKPATAALWRSYRDVRTWEHQDEALWLTQAVCAGALNLVHTAYEMAQRVNDLTSDIVALLQIAINMLEQPKQAAKDLLGINIGVEE